MTFKQSLRYLHRTLDALLRKKYVENYIFCFLKVEKLGKDWNGRAVRLEGPYQDDGRREAAERGRHQRCSTAQKGTQVSTLISN